MRKKSLMLEKCENLHKSSWKNVRIYTKVVGKMCIFTQNTLEKCERYGNLVMFPAIFSNII